MLHINKVNDENKYGRCRGNFGDYEFFGTQTIEGSRKFQSLPLFGWRKNKIYLDNA
jgi:hypothetical protein